MKLTEEFPMSVKPVREGVYELQVYGFAQGQPQILRRYSRWFAGRWRLCAKTPDAAQNAVTPTSFAIKAWRGLAEDPNAEGHHV